MIVGLDIDGVIRDFTKGVSSTFVKFHPQIEEKDLPPADAWDYFEKYPWRDVNPSLTTDEEVKNASLDFVFNYGAEEIFLNSPIYSHAFDSVEKIKSFCKEHGIELRVISHQTPTTKMHTLNWLAKHNLDFDQYYFVGNHAVKWMSCDVMIDDSPMVLNAKPEGKHSIKVSHLYNVDTKSDFHIQDISETEKIFSYLKYIKTIK